jgi:hypothetical protein
VQLVAAIYWETGAIDDPRFPDYTMDGGEHRISSQVLEWLEAHRQFETRWPLVIRSRLAISPASAWVGYRIMSG